MLGWFEPTEKVTGKQLRRGLHALTMDGVFSQAMDAVVSGAFLVAFALALGANNIVIGLLAAVAPATQVLQIPTIYLVQRWRSRQRVTVLSSAIGRAMWLVIAALPWVVPGVLQVPLLFICLLGYNGMAAVSACSYNSWVRDLVPERIMGRYFARRTAWSMAVGAAASLVGGWFVDYGKHHHDLQLEVYSALFISGAAMGLFAVMWLGRMPEPRMKDPPARGLWRQVLEPLGNRNFRRLLGFTGTWTFALNFAGPFYVVYMLKRADLDMTTIILLSVFSQATNVAFLRTWGRLADRYSNKSTLGVAGLLMTLALGLWLFVTDLPGHWMPIGLLVVIHGITGIATAGATLCSGNLALKVAPRGSATSFLAANALVAGVMGMLAPALGGIMAHQLEPEQVSLIIQWIDHADSTSPSNIQSWKPFHMQGLDFLFLSSVVFAFYALHRLAFVRESGETGSDRVMAALYEETGQAIRGLTSVSGLLGLVYTPFTWFGWKNRRRR